MEAGGKGKGGWEGRGMNILSYWKKKKMGTCKIVKKIVTNKERNANLSETKLYLYILCEDATLGSCLIDSFWRLISPVFISNLTTNSHYPSKKIGRPRDRNVVNRETEM